MTSGQEGGRGQGVVSAAPFIISQVMLSTDANVSGVVVKGIDPGKEGNVTELLVYLTAGRLQDLQTTQDNLTGSSWRRTGQAPRRLGQGYPPDDLSPRDDDSMGMMPKMKRFRVVGIFRSGHFEFDNTLALSPLKAPRSSLTSIPGDGDRG